MEKHKVVSAERLEKWYASKKAKLSDELRSFKIVELEDELFHLRTLPLGEDQPVPLEGQVKMGKFDPDTQNFILGRVNRNRIMSGENKQKMHRVVTQLKRLSDKSDNNYIGNNLRKAYKSRELDLCGFLDGNWKRLKHSGSAWSDDQINIMRKLVGEMALIVELANEQGIELDPIFDGLHRLGSELMNCTKGCKKNCTFDHNHRKSRQKRKTAHVNFMIELSRIREKSSKKERAIEVPSTFEDLLAEEYGINL